MPAEKQLKDIQAVIDAKYVIAARDQYQDDGTIEVDDGAKVSHSDNGAYVQAWVWVEAESS